MVLPPRVLSRYTVMENIKVKQRALYALLASTAFAEVKERAAATAVEGNTVCPQVDQIALFKIGQFTDNCWNVLRCAIKDKVKLEKRVYTEKRVARLQGELWPVSIEFVGMTV
jgi:hypothetical protein